MNKFKKTALVILPVLLLAVFLVAEPLSAKPKASATISYMEGKVMAKKKGGKYKIVTKNTELTADYTLKTDKKAKVELTLPDKSILRIAPLSVVKLKSIIRKAKKKKGKSDFKVTAGKIWANVSKAVGGKQNFEVSTNSAVAGVRGTIFRVDVNDDQATVVRVYSGAVAVSNSPLYARKVKKGKRVQVQGPQEVSKKKWEEQIAKSMQEVRVTLDGIIKLTEFPVTDKDEWAKWNEERDKKLGLNR